MFDFGKIFSINSRAFFTRLWRFEQYFIAWQKCNQSLLSTSKHLCWFTAYIKLEMSDVLVDKPGATLMLTGNEINLIGPCLALCHRVLIWNVYWIDIKSVCKYSKKSWCYLWENGNSLSRLNWLIWLNPIIWMIVV